MLDGAEARRAERAYVLALLAQSGAFRRTCEAFARSARAPRSRAQEAKRDASTAGKLVPLREAVALARASWRRALAGSGPADPEGVSWQDLWPHDHDLACFLFGEEEEREVPPQGELLELLGVKVLVAQGAQGWIATVQRGARLFGEGRSREEAIGKVLLKLQRQELPLPQGAPPCPHPALCAAEGACGVEGGCSTFFRR